MGNVILFKGGGDGAGSGDTTAVASTVLSGKTFIGSGSNDLPISGTITDKSNATIDVTPTISGGQLKFQNPEKAFLDTNTTIRVAKTSIGNASSAHVLNNATFSSQNGIGIPGTIASTAAGTWYASTSAQTVASGKYLSGIQTLAAVTQSGMTGANIKSGITITIKSGSTTLWSVAGSAPARQYKTGSVSTESTTYRETHSWKYSGSSYSTDLYYRTFTITNVGFTPRMLIMRAPLTLNGSNATWGHRWLISNGSTISQAYRLATGCEPMYPLTWYTKETWSFTSSRIHLPHRSGGGYTSATYTYHIF